MKDASGQLARFLHEKIPLARAMGVRVAVANGRGVTIEAPLGPNGNHHGTLFGGSASALAILAGWSWVHLRLEEEGVDPDLVIQKSITEFVRPGRSAVVVAHCRGASEQVWRRFMGTYRRFGRSRIQLAAELMADGEVISRLRGWFVALVPDTTA